MDAVEPRYNEKPAGSGDYIFMVGFVLLVLLLLAFTYAFHNCRRSRSAAPPSISFVNTSSDDAYNEHHIRFSPGLDDDVLVTFPSFVYSEAAMPHKGDTTADTSGSGCSICLADYKPTDVVRLLPECGHFFHVKCIDTWLKAHPTCPVCRNSPLDGTVPLPVQGR
ncbi:hypothetical protein L1887_09673 [Cichorium endivia]|nr:hypothetical protein L1887_09673 [Cichorium endivia]